MPEKKAINVRPTQAQAKLIDEAAALDGRSRHNWIIHTLVEQAKQQLAARGK